MKMSVSIMLSGNGELDSKKISEISSHAEKKGFDGFWVGETTIRDASVLTAVAACATKRIQLGTSIVNTFTRTPGQLAMMGATMNELSEGRFTLGLGVSTAAIVENWHGQAFDNPIERLDETVRLLRQYFSGERFSLDGAFFSPRGARLKMTPAPKIALAALNDEMIKKAAGLSDRVILNLYPVERMAHAVSLIEKVQQTVEGKIPPILSVMLYADVLGDDEKGVEAAKDLVAFYASAPAYSSLFSSLGFDAEARSMMAAWKAKDRSSVKRVITREMIDTLMILGTVDDLRARVKDYHENGVEDVFIAPSPFREFEANVNEVIQEYY